MTHPIRKAVFPVAGLGSRFLPATIANPKEMLPIVDKPLIQYSVEEAIKAGITQLIFVTSFRKRAIEDHFDRNFELETVLAERGKHALLKEITSMLPSEVSCVYVRQKEALGLGHAVLCAKDIVGHEPFAVLLADELINGDPQPCLTQMLSTYENVDANVIGVQAIDPSTTEKYGIVAVDDNNKATRFVEKPTPERAPSNLAAVGRYILKPDIFSQLETLTPGAGGELQLTDAIAAMVGDDQVYAHTLTGKRYDCGSKLGYLQATVEFALTHPEVGERFKKYLTHLFDTLSTAETP